MRTYRDPHGNPVTLMRGGLYHSEVTNDLRYSLVVGKRSRPWGQPRPFTFEAVWIYRGPKLIPVATVNLFVHIPVWFAAGELLEPVASNAWACPNEPKSALLDIHREDVGYVTDIRAETLRRHVVTPIGPADLPKYIGLRFKSPAWDRLLGGSPV